MSPRASLNVALERAIYERNCNEVKILIAAGADINHTVNDHLDTMLHKAKTAGIARDLLGYSANVNAKNLFDRTPLHTAVLDGRSADVVQALIEHGPNVNARDSKGLTPLHYAVKSKNVDLIRCLVMNDANISFKEVLTDLSPLCSAMLQEDLTGVKALIKYGLLKDFEDNYARVIDLHSYYRMKNFFMVRIYLNQCGTELLKMKEEKMSDEVTLFQIIKSKCVPLESLYKDSKGMESFTKRAFEVITSNGYPHYNDVITERLRNKLQVSSLRSMLSIVQISSADTKESEQMTLNPDVNAVLAKYLPKNDLFNLIVASFEPYNHEIDPRNLTDINFIKRSITNLTAPSAAISSPKRMKLI